VVGLAAAALSGLEGSVVVLFLSALWFCRVA
jgi:hypothetical protein